MLPPRQDRSLTTSPVADAGEVCRCGKPAIRRELLRGKWPRVYVGACKEHLAEVVALTDKRSRSFDAQAASSLDRLRHIMAAKDRAYAERHRKR